jgi:hypothetical protein
MAKRPLPLKPVESFGPEIFQALVEGSKRRIELRLPYAKAVYFRMRVNQLRNQMRLQGHEGYSAVSQARLTIAFDSATPIRKSRRGVRIPMDVNVPVTLIISPSDSEFADILAQAGVMVPQLSNETSTAPSIPIEDDVLAEFLKK